MQQCKAAQEKYFHVFVTDNLFLQTFYLSDADIQTAKEYKATYIELRQRM